MPPGTIPDESEIALNLPVLVFALVVSAVTSVICGLAPALHSSGRDLAGSMREVSRSLAGSSRQAILRKALVVGEVALSLMLLAGSSVLLRAFVGMQRVELGVAGRSRADDARAAAGAALSGCAAPDCVLPGAAAARGAVPGVAAAAVNSGLHPMGNMWTAAEVAGEAPNTDPVQVHHISAGLHERARHPTGGGTAAHRRRRQRHRSRSRWSTSDSSASG